MIKIKDLRPEDVGKWVFYKIDSKLAGETEEGKISSWNDKFIFVVYRCAGNWDRFREYTGQATKEEDLTYGNN
jgi:hypothetical protein